MKTKNISKMKLIVSITAIALVTTVCMATLGRTEEIDTPLVEPATNSDTLNDGQDSVPQSGEELPGVTAPAENDDENEPAPRGAQSGQETPNGITLDVTPDTASADLSALLVGILAQEGDAEFIYGHADYIIERMVAKYSIDEHGKLVDRATGNILDFFTYPSIVIKNILDDNDDLRRLLFTSGELPPGFARVMVEEGHSEKGCMAAYMLKAYAADDDSVRLFLDAWK